MNCNSVSINPNSRNNPVLHQTDLIENETVKRITAIAIPFLNLYQPTAILVNIGMGGVKIYSHIKVSVICLQNSEWALCGKECVQLAFTVGSIALSILMPAVGILVSNTVQLALDVHRFATSLFKGEFFEAAKALLSIGHTVIYLASIFYASPEIILISIIAQAAMEFYRSASEFQQGRYLECLANLVMGLIRCQQARPYLKTVNRNLLGKSLTQDQLKEFISQAKAAAKKIEGPGSQPSPASNRQDGSFQSVSTASQETVKQKITPFNLDKILEDNFISSYIENISFAYEDLSEMQITNLSLKNCDFSGSRMQSTLIANVKFNNCVFDDAKVTHSLIVNTSFFDSSCKGTEWNHSVFSGVSWLRSDLSQSYFNDATLYRVSFEACRLFETCFLSTAVGDSKITDCDLTDCLLLRTKDVFQIRGGKPHQITRPIIGLLWNFESSGTFAGAVKENVKGDYNGIVLKFEYLPQDIDTVKLDGEVKEILNLIKDNPPGELSIAEAILKHAKPGSEIEKIKFKAEEALESADAIVFPGGEDIHPELYGEAKESNTHHDADYRRPILEFAAIDQAKQKKIFTLGICRGSQIVNVYHGGKLKQHEEGQFGISQDLEVEKNLSGKPLEIVNEVISDKIRGYSAHHQASQKIGKGLKRVVHYKGITKMIVSDDGQFILTQFHPEIYPIVTERNPEMCQQNRRFFDYLMKRAWEHKLERRRIEAAAAA